MLRRKMLVCYSPQDNIATLTQAMKCFHPKGLVRFIPMNVDDEESIQDLLMQIDNVIQYGEDADVKVHDFDPPEEEDE